MLVTSLVKCLSDFHLAFERVTVYRYLGGHLNVFLFLKNKILLSLFYFDD